MQFTIIIGVLAGLGLAAIDQAAIYLRRHGSTRLALALYLLAIGAILTNVGVRRPLALAIAIPVGIAVSGALVYLQYRYHRRPLPTDISVDL